MLGGDLRIVGIDSWERTRSLEYLVIHHYTISSVCDQYTEEELETTLVSVLFLII